MSVDPFSHPVPNVPSEFILGIEGLSLGEVFRPKAGDIDPLFFREEKWFGEDDAADEGVDLLPALFGTVFLNGGSQRRIIGRAVLFAEGVPSQRDREEGMTDEETAADDVIVGIVEFEQKGRAGVEGFKPGFAAGLPKINFVGAEL